MNMNTTAPLSPEVQAYMELLEQAIPLEEIKFPKLKEIPDGVYTFSIPKYDFIVPKPDESGETKQRAVKLLLEIKLLNSMELAPTAAQESVLNCSIEKGFEGYDGLTKLIGMFSKTVDVTLPPLEILGQLTAGQFAAMFKTRTSTFAGEGGGPDREVSWIEVSNVIRADG